MQGMIRWVTTGATTFGLMVMVLALSASVSSASSVGANWHWGGGGSNNTTASNTFNLSADHPKWHTGNLCTVQINGSVEVCQYDGSTANTSGSGYGGCGTCVPALTYNFSGSHKTIYIEITNLSKTQNKIVLNLHGNHDTVYLNISGCHGGSVNMSTVGQHDVLYVNYSASFLVSDFYFYLDQDSFFANVTGSADYTTTYFAGVGVHQNICPYRNMSNMSTVGVTASGWFDTQNFVWANGMGYSSAYHTTGMPGGGFWNHIGWKNTTTLSCGWSRAPACSHSGHHFGVADLVGATRP